MSSDLNLKNVWFSSIGDFFLKKPLCPKLGAKFLISDTNFIFRFSSVFKRFNPYFGHFLSFKKQIYIQ
jgi:hypothetical protein